MGKSRNNIKSRKTRGQPNNISAMSKHNKKVRDRANAKARLDIYIQTVCDMVDDEYVFVDNSSVDNESIMATIDTNSNVSSSSFSSSSIEDDDFYNCWCADDDDIYFENNPWFAWTVKSVIRNIFN